MEDRKEKILEILNLFLIDSQRSKETAAPFKVRAYQNAIKAIKAYEGPIVSIEDVDYLFKNKLIGKKIRDKMYEIIETGELKEAEMLQKTVQEYENIRNQLLNIYGIGSVKADELITEYNVRTLDDLRALVLDDPDFLTEAQTLGLAFYADLQQRIPRLEILEHEKYIRNFIQDRVPEFNITIVGSYRRGEPTSGDIDVLISYHSLTEDVAKNKFKRVIEEFSKDEYCVGALGKGVHKFMGIVQIDPSSLARRLDILLTKPEEFVFALLYFTGSQNFNIAFRKLANSKGYTLNEHRMKIFDDVENVPTPPVFTTEKDIFDFLGVKYLTPEERTNNIRELEMI